LYISETRLSIRALDFITSNGLVTVFNQPVDFAYQCAMLISRLKEMVLIGSDRSHRIVSIRLRIIVVARRGMNRKRYSRESTGEYICVG